MNPHLIPLLILFLSFNLSFIQSLTISGYGIKDLESSTHSDFLIEASMWRQTISQTIPPVTQTTTSMKWLIGGETVSTHPLNPGSTLFFERTLTDLPPHSFIGVTILFWFFDNYWGTSLPELQFSHLTSDVLILGPRLNQADFTSEEGGQSGIPDLGHDHIKYGFSHSSSSLTLNIRVALNTDIQYQSLGFRELHIHLSNYSGTVPDLCHSSEEKYPLKHSQCDCALNQAKDSNGICVDCAANCDICFGSEDVECLACSAGSYWDGEKCNACHLMCRTCTGPTANECGTCKFGFYHYQNDTCSDTCEIPYVPEQMGLDKHCQRMCNSSQFYWRNSQTCLDSCEPPLTHALDEYGMESCTNPCSGTNQYLHVNGSCGDVCKPPLILDFQAGVKFCLNPCSDPATDYLYPNRSCFSDCPWPLLSRTEPGTNYCWNPCPSASQFLYNNGSCLYTCPAPLMSRSESGVRYCFTPCDSVGDYIYDDRSCSDACSSPLVSRIEPMVARYCLSPCPLLSFFLYPNGSCSAECALPLLNKTEQGVKFCYNPCSSMSDYIYQNGTCGGECPYPLMSHAEPDFKYCFSPCPTSKYLYSDQSCHDSCDSPLIKRLEPGVNYCHTPCLDISDYVYSDGICSSACEYPYKVLTKVGYKVCSLGLNEIQIHQAHALAIGTDIANTVSGLGGILTGFVTSGDPTSMLMWSLLKMLQFTKYIDVNFPGQMAVIFVKQNDHYRDQDGYMSSAGDNGRVLSQNDSSKKLGRFSYYNMPQSFLENYWQQLIIFGSLIILMIISAIVLRFLQNPQYIKLVKHIQSALRWNVVLIFFCGSYGDLVLYSAIESQTVAFDGFGSIISFIVFVFMVILAVYIPLKVLHVINQIRRQKDSRKKWANHRMFFEIYKSDQLIKQIFLIIYLLRVGFFNIVIGYVFRSPLTQALLINLMSFFMTAYLLLKVPIKDKLCFVQHVTLESMLLIYNICLLVLVSMDLTNTQAEGTRAFFGGIMVVIMIVGPIATALLIVFKLFLKLKESYYQFKKQREAIELAGPVLPFKKVRTRGTFIIGNNELEGNAALADESKMIVISQNGDQKSTNLESIEPMTFKNEAGNGMMEVNLERNIEGSTVQIITKKERNLKRRKVNLFKDNNFQS